MKQTAKADVPILFTRHGGKQAITPGGASHEFCGVRLGNAGCTTTDLLSIMGWESPQIAKTYIRTSEDRLRFVVGLFEPSSEQRV